MIPLMRVPDMAEDVSSAVASVLASGFIGQGPKVDQFERELGQRIGNPRVATVNSGTSGLHLGLRLATSSGGAERAWLAGEAEPGR